MADPVASPAALPEPTQASEPAPESVGQPSLPSPPSQEPADPLDGWKKLITREEQGFYDEQDCLHPSYNLASEELKDRKEDDAVIFNYSLDTDYLGRVDGNPPAGGDPTSAGRISPDDDIFFRVSKDELLGSKQFDQIINPLKEARQSLTQGQRLGIIDFPQCYDTQESSLLNSMGEKLGLQRNGETTYMDKCLQGVPKLPAPGHFRTGISLRASFKEPTGLPKPGSSEDRFILFVSFPYVGESSNERGLDSERESIKLREFKRLGVGVRGREAPVGRGGSYDPKEISVEKGEILVHQAQYMIFDNYTMATFRSKEDSARGQVPLHRFQERIGAFRAVVHMIANRMDLELWTLGKLRDSLCQLEEDIDQMISDAKTYEDNQGMEITPDDNPQNLTPSIKEKLTTKERLKWDEDYDRARQNKVHKRKQRRVRDLLTALNRLSADLFAAISVAERQIAVLQDLYNIFLTSYRTKTKDYEKGYPLRRNPFHKNIVTIPILSENPEQIWPNTLDTIDEVVRERKFFIQEVKELVENMDIRRKILSAFLKSDQAKAAPSERTAQEATEAMKRTEKIIEETQAQLVQQGQTLTGFTIVTTAFLPLGFCTSYFGMQTIKEFGGPTPQMSLRKFWLTSGPVLAAILLFTVVVVLWKRPLAEKFKTSVKEKLGLSPREETDHAKEQRPVVGGAGPRVGRGLSWTRRKKTSDEEAPNPQESAPAQANSHEQQKVENGG
ncbi:hypothetical protein B9Z19DRAFT_1080732 [Tuber borchii]|uniref:Uncharacterized protein n=1 Tax=Tuber borchii TaxID=42251 RepID=A0A2T6ZWI6_TUBBO|nr:hypothetical protein B9Z19DRAFT_1080732 [Tuber borchii]